MKHIRLLAVAVTTGLVIASVVACGSSRFDEAKEDVKQTGTLSVALTATANGTTYRLRMATFTVTGPQSASLSSETDINAADITQTLTEGSGYSITLGGTWFIERVEVDGGATQVNAALIGPVTRFFTIVANGGTNVQYTFNVDGTPIVLGAGLLDVTIGVNQCPTGQVACASGCADLKTDANNCGTCGNACSPGLVCQDGTSCVPCPAGMTYCSGTCVDTNSDPANCGMCGVACPSGKSCTMSVCQ